MNTSESYRTRNHHDASDSADDIDSLRGTSLELAALTREVLEQVPEVESLVTGKRDLTTLARKMRLRNKQRDSPSMAEHGVLMHDADEDGGVTPPESSYIDDEELRRKEGKEHVRSNQTVP